MNGDPYRTVFDESPDGILVVDEDGIIRDANPMSGTLFGYSPEELVGLSVERLVPDEVRPFHARHRANYMEAPRARPMGIGLELRGQRRDGSQFPVEISLSPHRSDGEVRVIATVRDVTQRMRLRDFGAGALRASEEERQRIARELHDDTAQRLAALLIRLKLVEREAERGALAEGLEQLRGELKGTIDGVRRIARGLRPPELQDAGVVAALQAHVRSVRESTELDVRLEAEPIDAALDTDTKLVLYRIVQEALSNAVRHSGATVIAIRVYGEDGRVVGLVEDEGCGFSTQEGGDEGGGLGLVGMAERAAMVGGRLRVDSEPGRGTVVRVELPTVERRGGAMTS